MTIFDLQKQYPINETDLILSHFLKLSPHQLFLHPNKKIYPPVLKKISRAISKLQHNVPLAYILGYKYFYGLKFKTSRHTLIPRPESEWLVDQAINYISQHQKISLDILDLGTGSGCLAISIAKFARHPSLNIFASDISAYALKTAKQNATLHKTPITFYNDNLLNKPPVKFQMCVINLPYVPLKDYNKLNQSLKYEPQSAITHPNLPAFYDQLFAQFHNNMTKNLILFIEFDPSLKNLFQQLQQRYLPNQTISFKKDLRQFWRYCIIK